MMIYGGSSKSQLMEGTMLASSVTGYLANEPKVAFNNATGPVYRLRFATNHNQYDTKTKTWKKKTIWCSGLVTDKKMGMMKPFFKKGAPIVASSSDCHISSYAGADGVTRFDFDMGYIEKVEVYQRLPREEVDQVASQASLQQAASQGAHHAPPSSMQHEDELPGFL